MLSRTDSYIRRSKLGRTSSLLSDASQLEWNAAVEDDLRQIVRLAVREDLGRGQDWTTVALVAPGVQGRGAMVAREAGVVAGLRAVPVMIDEMHAAIDVELRAADGDEVAAGQVVAELAGSARDMLVCERPLLNLLGRLSGIATLTREYVRAIEGTRARIYDTRKTTPGWRRLEKYAVRCGGGMNHRVGLFDAVLIKDNHLALAADQGLSPAQAVAYSQNFIAQIAPEGALDRYMLVEVELDRLDELESVLKQGLDIILLDNMSCDELRQAVAIRDRLAPHVQLEASGGVTLATVREIAETGVERISVGEITHSSPALDVALDWLPPQTL